MEGFGDDQHGNSPLDSRRSLGIDLDFAHCRNTVLEPGWKSAVNRRQCFDLYLGLPGVFDGDGRSSSVGTCTYTIEHARQNRAKSSDSWSRDHGGLHDAGVAFDVGGWRHCFADPAHSWVLDLAAI
jgi:hypothetical protein